MMSLHPDTAPVDAEHIDLHSANDEDFSLRTSEVTPEVINYLRQRIVEAISPRQIVLFGSQARGDAESDSDIDLLVVHDQTESDRELRRRLDRLFLERRFGLDLLVRSEQAVALNLADGNPFYTEHIYEQGRILYQR